MSERASMLKEYHEQGYVVLKGLAREDRSTTLFRAVAGALKRFHPDAPVLAEAADTWENPEFTEKMLELRRGNPQAFGALYDTLQSNAMLYDFVGSSEIVQAAASLLGDCPEGLSLSGQMLRMDPPGDRRNALDWHQEYYAYKQNSCADHGLVCWIPLHRMREEHGTILVCPGSHKEGVVEMEQTSKSDFETSEQFRVPDEYLNRYPSVPVECELGDVVLFHLCLFHRSGENVSSQLRFAAGVRFHRAFVEDFIPGSFVYRFNTYVESLLSDSKK